MCFTLTRKPETSASSVRVQTGSTSSQTTAAAAPGEVAPAAAAAALFAGTAATQRLSRASSLISLPQWSSATTVQ